MAQELYKWLPFLKGFAGNDGRSPEERQREMQKQSYRILTGQESAPAARLKPTIRQQTLGNVIKSSTEPISSTENYENDTAGFLKQVGQELNTLGYDYTPGQQITRLSGSTPAPDRSAATGTQLSMRQPSPEEMLSFLGGAQNLAMYGRAASDLVPGMGIREADVPLSRLANEDDMEDMLYGGRTPEEINRLQRGEALDEVVIDSDYELSDAEKGQKSTEDIKKMVRERNAFRKAAKPETQTEKTVERPQVDGKTDYMVPYRNAEMMRRGAFLDADSSMQGLKNREMQRGYITAGGKKYSITNDFLKSNDPADLRAELSGEEVSQLKAQELLNDNIKNVTAASATAQNPMLGIGEGFDATDGKTTKYMDVSTANFAENNATPAEMNKEFNPFGYDPEFEQYDQNYFG